ncbi:gliding motility lipoprotein GldH [Phaeodactylibacter xiamenensis]|uniref:gliding motility lipoprotein GldH n=1 Tax=Phaeodactylibacter xiamenensis TaxID=1524460 RepID=UPI0024A8C212|nr:gliding motility lipoprotein GldH [Phaeodactylibacter xiamenensis]
MHFGFSWFRSGMLIVLLTTGLLSFSSCGPNYIFNTEKEIPETGWAYDEPVSFSFKVEDTTKIYNLWLEVGHTSSYSNQNLYTRIQTIFPDGNELSEVVSLELADKGGQWLGACSGQECALKVPLQTGTYFNQIGEYTLEMEQYTRRDSLKEVRNLRFMVEDTGIRR